MATRSAISTTKYNLTKKAFATFRVAGDTLVPEDVTKFLEVIPTHSQKKGQPYSTGRSSIVPTTGVWLFSTDHLSSSTDIYRHLYLLLFIILGLPGNIPSEQESVFTVATRLLRLKELLEQKAFTAAVTLFWHGSPNATVPKLPDKLTELLRSVPIAIETDFDRDEETDNPRHTGVAA